MLKIDKLMLVGWHKSYETRNMILKDLGFADYPAYLESDLWKDIRARVAKRDDYVCQLCKTSRGTQCHHVGYTVRSLNGEDTSSIMCVCRPCHMSIENCANGFKLGALESFQKSIEILGDRLEHVNIDPNDDDRRIGLLIVEQRVKKGAVASAAAKKAAAANKVRDKKIRRLQHQLISAREEVYRLEKILDEI